MKIEVAHSDLKEAIKVVKETLGKDTQGHEGIRIYAGKSGKKIKITTNDGSYATEIWVPATVREAGKIVVKGKSFIQYVEKLDVDKITLFTKDHGGVVLKSKRGQQTFQSFDEKSFQVPPKVESSLSFDMAGRTFKQLIQSVAFATDDSKQPTKPIMQGIHFASDGKSLELCTTNGIVVAHYKKKMKAKELDVVLGKKSLVNSAKIIKDDEKVTISANADNRFVIKVGEVTYHVPTLAGTYPNVKSILPGKDFPLQFTAEKDELIGVLDRASSMLDSTGILHFEQGKVTLSGKTETHDFSEYITTKIQGTASDVKVNLKRMYEIVKNIDADLIHIGIRDKQPITVRPEGKTAHTCILAVG